MRRNAGLGTLALLLLGCGKELARLPIKAEGTQETALQVQSGKALSFWTYFDAEDDGSWRPLYQIDLLQEGAVKAHAACNPYDVSVKTNSRELHVGNRRSVHWDAKMRCELVPPFTGAATVRVLFESPTHPAGLKLADATLLVKQ